jgi:hypothetical protein
MHSHGRGRGRGLLARRARRRSGSGQAGGNWRWTNNGGAEAKGVRAAGVRVIRVRSQTGEALHGGVGGQFTSGQLDQQRIPQIRDGCSRIPIVYRARVLALDSPSSPPLPSALFALADEGRKGYTMVPMVVCRHPMPCRVAPPPTREPASVLARSRTGWSASLGQELDCVVLASVLTHHSATGVLPWYGTTTTASSQRRAWATSCVGQ